MLLLYQLILHVSEKNVSERIQKRIMVIDDRIRDEKLEYNINREAGKISTLSSQKIDKYKYLTVEGNSPTNQRQLIEQAKFAYSPLGKAFEKETKTIEYQGGKQIKTIENTKNNWKTKNN